MSITPIFTASASYYADFVEGPHQLFVAVACQIGNLTVPARALLDTGSQWCVVPAEIARTLECDLTPDPDTPPLHTRFGLLYGRLERLPIRFLADEGESLEVQATCFLSEVWTGPTVIGWKGCLERLRFALDPGENAFYFASL